MFMHILFFHSSVDDHLSCFSFSFELFSLVQCCCEHSGAGFCVDTFSALEDIPKVKLVGQMVTF